MTTSQTLELRASEIRQRLNAIAGMDDLSDDVRQESDKLTEEYASVETRRRAALIAEDAERVETHATEPDAETRERAALRQRAYVGAYIAARLTGARLPTECAEYGAACGAPAGEIPVDLFEADRPAT